MESKLRSLHSSIYSVTDAIRTKESETNYKGLALNIQQLAEDLNNAIKRSLN